MSIRHRLMKLEQQTLPARCYAIEKCEGEPMREAYRLAGIEGLPPLENRLLGVTEMRS